MALCSTLKKDIQPVTTFRRNPARFPKKPLILTVNGKAEAVVQDLEAYRCLLEPSRRCCGRESLERYPARGTVTPEDKELRLKWLRQIRRSIPGYAELGQPA
jgi:hypothetical protein